MSLRQRSYSSAGQSVRLITVRSAVQARVGPSVCATGGAGCSHLLPGTCAAARTGATLQSGAARRSTDRGAIGSHSSAGQSVRPITVRSAVQARVGPSVCAAGGAGCSHLLPGMCAAARTGATLQSGAAGRGTDMGAIGSHSSAGQSVRPITVRSAVQARVGPSVCATGGAVAATCCRVRARLPGQEQHCRAVPTGEAPTWVV